MRRKIHMFMATLLITILSGGPVVLAQSSSSNYKVNESSFSSGGEYNASSSNYSGSANVGLNAVGNASSTNFDVVAGLITPDVPFLEFVVTGAVVDLGLLDSNSTSSGAAQAGACGCSFYVRSYVSSSYVVSTISPPPVSEGGAFLTSKAAQAVPSSDQSVEEFGINLVANTAPAIGINPVNQPDGSFADGTAASGYEVPDQFKYAQGDIIARSAATVGNKAWGQTDYTISYIAKSNPVSPAGLYSMAHHIVVTATY